MRIYRYQIAILLLLSTPPMFAVNGDSDLIGAAKTGDLTIVSRILEAAVDVNTAEADGTTALHWAAHLNDLDLAGALIKTGADASSTNDYGVTPLYLACTNRSDVMVELLLQAGADPSAALWTGETVLMNCARTGANGAVKALLIAGAKVHASESNQGQTALMWAAAMGHAEVVRLLLSYGADTTSRTTAAFDRLPNTCRICDWKPSQGGFTPLMFAARSGDMETARLLLEAGANPDEATSEAGNSLVIASASGHEDLAIWLLNMGADPDSADENGVTALHHSFRHALSRMHGITYDPVYRVRPVNMPGLTRALLKAGANPNAQILNSYNIGPAIRDKCESISGMGGATPFILAAVSSDVSLMHLLLESGADPGLSARDGTTPLMAAAQAACTVASQRGDKKNVEEVNRSLQAVKMLIESGVDINVMNSANETAMHMAAFSGAETVVKYLAEQGADVDVRNRSGETPWSMASGISPVLEDRGAYGSHEGTAAMLLSLGATRISRDDMIIPDAYLNPTEKAVSIEK